jgi:hypothetical protein
VAVIAIAATSLATASAVTSSSAATASTPQQRAAKMFAQTKSQYPAFRTPDKLTFDKRGNLVGVEYTNAVKVTNAQMAKAVAASKNSPAVATPKKATANPRLTLQQAVVAFRDDSIGPSTNTNYGRGTFTNWVLHGSGDSRYWTASVSVTNQNPYYRTDSKAPAGKFHANSWWNPASWNWSGILGGFWNNVLVPCFKGIASGFMGSFGGSLISHAWFYFASNAEEVAGVTPQGLAISVAVGCTLGILRNAAS